MNGLLFPTRMAPDSYVLTWNRARHLVALMLDVVEPALCADPLQRLQLVAWSGRNWPAVHSDVEPWVPDLDALATEWSERSVRGLVRAKLREAVRARYAIATSLIAVQDYLGATREKQMEHLLTNTYWRVADFGYDPGAISRENLEAIAGAVVGLSNESSLDGWGVRLQMVMTTVLGQHARQGNQP
jgi:hypothetical protein